jgi:hypothetical protein
VEGGVEVIDRVGVGSVSCKQEGGKARIGLEKKLEARSVVVGYGRLFFRMGEGFSASFKHVSVDGRASTDISVLSIPIRESAGLVRYFYGVLCAPAAKIDIPHGIDVWLMLFTPINNDPSIEVSKPLLITDKASVQASLSVDEGALRYSLSAYGSGFRSAGLVLVRCVDTGVSMSHGFERSYGGGEACGCKARRKHRKHVETHKRASKDCAGSYAVNPVHERCYATPPSPWMQRPKQTDSRPQHSTKSFHIRRRRPNQILGKADA